MWIAVVTLLLACLPPSAQGPHTDVYHGVTVADPDRWLEDLDSPRVLDDCGGGSGEAPQAPALPPVNVWQSMFDGESLKGWKETPFTGRGKVRVEKGTIILETGYMTGITWTGPFPLMDYEVRYEAARLEGSDFYASITFPVNDSHATWVLGGWGGNLVGLSSLDGMDASENETGNDWQFERGRFYTHTLRVAGNRISAWIDNDPAIDVVIGHRVVDLRPGEIELNRPLGFASWSTTGAIRKIEYRRLPPPQPAERKSQ